MIFWEIILVFHKIVQEFLALDMELMNANEALQVLKTQIPEILLPWKLVCGYGIIQECVKVKIEMKSNRYS